MRVTLQRDRKNNAARRWLTAALTISGVAGFPERVRAPVCSSANDVHHSTFVVKLSFLLGACVTHGFSSVTCILVSSIDRTSSPRLAAKIIFSATPYSSKNPGRLARVVFFSRCFFFTRLILLDF
ncbi:hypothetical protein P280DRAFT_164607 [Massarina eburnea CBS 473.64]|uniref:Uncharacterized protein n=1 Tax=Massarina eburnea CBS 473.64 TaxID=1395130 RepID=A0A6A6RMP5_9PLEO|nr:hypothetical protein P280DRAFT_164607 [Massarina eburnea CBS 473.64]